MEIPTPKAEDMPNLDVRLLGPLEVLIDGESVAVPRGNTATVLAVLLDEANSVIPLNDIVFAVYGYDPPQDPETQVQNTVGVLRRRLGPHRDRIATVGRAYRFTIVTGELDLLRCKAKDAEARRLRTEGDLAGAAAALREALAEWRGPALADLSGPTVEAVRRRYDEHRLTLLERRIGLDLELGRHTEVVEELRQIVAVHDTRQRFTALLMRALHASGRATEALEVYEALRTRLADALGADPNRELLDLHLTILRDDQPPAAHHVEPAAPRRVPTTLPRANTRFTGREKETRLLDGLLDAADGEAGLAVVTGMGGVGKTALAVRWAHRVAHRFPDGQLYVNLRGFDPAAPAADPNAVLGETLAAFGVEAHRLPAGLDERVGLYRTVLARRKVLLVLDNVRDAAQVRPLLPVAPGSFTLVTSRDRLAGLDAAEGADVVRLGVLPESEAWALLVRRIGMDRALAEEGPVRRIVAACDRLPLALTLIGAWVAANPDLPLAVLSERLERATNVFKVLAHIDLASDPRSVFACSYQALSTAAAQAFRLFGLHPGPDLTVAAMASLMGAPRADAETALAELASVNLVDQFASGRYTMHDLLRAYAKERYAEEVGPERRRAAEERMLDYFVYSTHAADQLLTLHGGSLTLGEPGPGVTPEPVPDLRAASAWFTAEYDVLLDLTRRGPALDDVRAWRLAWCLAEYMLGRNLGRDLEETQTAALAAAERSGDGFGQIVSLGYLSGALMFAEDREGATERLGQAMALAETAGQPWAHGFIHFGLSVQAAREDRHADACAAARSAERHFAEAGDLFWRFRSVWVVGWHAVHLGAFDEGRACFDELLAVSQEVDAQAGIANAHLGYGLIARLEGRFDAALDHYGLARRVFAEMGVDPAVALVREQVGDTLDARGDKARAVAEWHAAEHVYEEFSKLPELARVRTKLTAR
jgi:DNA-binding SARP family transcriptional activator